MTDGPPGDAPNPYVFVVGCQRSGTTLLQRMLDHHPQLAVGYDSHFIPRPIKRLAVGVDPPLTPEIVESVRGFSRFARLGIPDAVTQEAAAGAATYREFVRNLYSAFGEMHGKPLAGEKSPGYCRHLPHLHGLFPWARTIHILRDGRDVALSIRDWGKGPSKLALFREESVATCALWWRRDVTVGRRDGRLLAPDRYHEIRYESICADPEAAMRELATFLDLPFDEAMVRFHEGKTRPLEPGRSTKSAWLPPTPGLRDWRSQMPEREVELFEALAGDLLSELGYERAFPRCSPGIVEVAERCRAWWEENLSARRRGDAPDKTDDDDGKPRRARRHAVAPGPVADSPNPYVFIVGCPRSGTTLLKRIVDAHPAITITPETHWVPRFYRKRVGVTRDGLTTDELVPRLLAYHKFKNLKLDPAEVSALVAAGPRRYAEVATGIFDLFGRQQGKALVGDKTPGYVRHIALLHELWPRARFVHLVRDGRAVCLSMLDWDRAARTAGRFSTWEDDPVSTSALWWEQFVRVGREAGAALDSGLYHEIRYEAVIDEPAATCKALCSFLDLPYDDAMVRFHEGRTRPDPTMSPKRGWHPITAGLRDWRSQMPPEDIERFEAAAGDLLDELGYERACPRPGAAAIEHAARLRDRFTKDPHFRS